MPSVDMLVSQHTGHLIARVDTQLDQFSEGMGSTPLYMGLISIIIETIDYQKFNFDSRRNLSFIIPFGIDIKNKSINVYVSVEIDTPLPRMDVPLNVCMVQAWNPHCSRIELFFSNCLNKKLTIIFPIESIKYCKKLTSPQLASAKWANSIGSWYLAFFNGLIKDTKFKGFCMRLSKSTL
ncbi:hypothetical protein AGLY_013799 [Aphis glycines]|uniref:Uncharacterized protein n=1 Tax=Aphis glycines TaxID=307491 RepID=A0A6G0T535_APHGL|nr:hypothetical protein AGLY_013799 [Aphis glycines]